MAPSSDNKRIRFDFEQAERLHSDPRARADAARAIVGRIDPAVAPTVEIRTRRLHKGFFDLLERASAAGAGSIRVRIVGPKCLRPEGMHYLARTCPGVALEVILEGLPAADSGPESWCLPQLRAVLDAIGQAELDASVSFEVRAEEVDAFDALVEVATAVVSATSAPLQLRLSSAEHAEARGEEPLSLSRVGTLMTQACRAPRFFRVRSESGAPHCLFGTEEAGAAGRGDLQPRRPDTVFGPRCGDCPAKPTCTGVSPGYAEGFGTDELAPREADAAAAPAGGLGWEEQARLLLIEHPEVKLQLSDLLPSDLMPTLPCSLPWRRLEVNSDGVYGPCCADYLVDNVFADCELDPTALWNSDNMKAIRRAVAGGDLHQTCRTSCPVLAGGVHRPDTVVLRGGNEALVENQIQMVSEMIAGTDEVQATPLELCVATTSFCNYRCLMCCVDFGPPEDQLSTGFYEGLQPMLGNMLMFDGNGGEPLASSTFRSFLADTDFSDIPHLRIHLTTNGSYLTPKQVAKYEGVPFSSLTISLNAATADTYLEVNRGLPWERMRANLDAILASIRSNGLDCTVRYSMVILKANIDEIVPFAQMVSDDGVLVRYLLPTRNNNDQSIMASQELMQTALDHLRDVERRFSSTFGEGDIAELQGVITVLEKRLGAGEFAVL